MKNIIELTEDSLETEVLRSQQPVVVDFYAPWCGPCRMLAPLLEQLAPEFHGRLKFAKMNVDDAPELASRYEVTGVPRLALFRSGRLIDALVGFASPKALKTWLENAVASPVSA